jgi:elongation factor P hydroxylase
VKWLQEHGYYFFAIPNEAHGRSMVSQMQLISMGLRAGVADLVIVLPAGRILFVEVKAPDGKQSDKQIKFQDRVESLGHKYVIVRSIDELIKIFSGVEK